MKVLVCGAGGAIGGHLVRALLNQGHSVRTADIKPRKEWWQLHHDADNYAKTDLRMPAFANAMTEGAEQVYDLAENMGGIGFIEENRVDCSESIEIGISLLRAAAKYNVDRFFFASSACVYPTHLQEHDARASGHANSLYLVRSLQEDDVWPAQPEEGYGLSKLYMEELCRHYTNERGLQTRVARYHNIYGPPASWNDGREKSPAAICRKVAECVHTGNDTISIWGNGRQVRSYLYVDDCVQGTIRLMNSNCSWPVNIGSEDAVTINELVSLVEAVAAVQLVRSYDMAGAQGVGGRNADVRMAKEILGWEPTTPLPIGLAKLYRWIWDQVSSGASSAHTSGPTPTTAVPV